MDFLSFIGRFLYLEAYIHIVVTRQDVFLTIGLFPGMTCNEIAKKIGKKQVAYDSIYKLAKKLKDENLIREEKGKFFLAEAQKCKALFWLLNFCLKNDIDYNQVVSQKTAEFVKTGLEKGFIEGLLFDAKTVRKIVRHLSRHGFAIVESKKPFVCKIVYSQFLEHLVEYFIEKPAVTCHDIVDCLDEKRLNGSLEKEFSAYKRLSKKKLAFDEVGFIYTSLTLEGNTLTLPETEKVIKQNITPAAKPFKDVQEVLDYKKALDNFIYSNKTLDLANVLGFHKIAMNTLAAGAGETRLQNVKIRGNPRFETPNWHEVPQLLDNFFKMAMQFKSAKKLLASQIVENAAFLHNEFQRIHPFVDGNSRTARAIFSKLLIDRGFPLVKIPVGFFDQYMNLTKLSEKRDDQKFALLMKQIVLENIKINRQKLEYAE